MHSVGAKDSIEELQVIDLPGIAPAIVAVAAQEDRRPVVEQAGAKRGRTRRHAVNVESDHATGLVTGDDDMVPLIVIHACRRLDDAILPNQEAGPATD